jgi:hypothetical protein
MLMVSLKFGRPPAKLWILAEEIVFACRARQHAEQLLMGQEDEAMQAFVSEEKMHMSRELFGMRLEDKAMRSVLLLHHHPTSSSSAAFSASQSRPVSHLDLTAHGDDEIDLSFEREYLSIQQAVSLAVKKGLRVLETEQYRLYHDKLIEGEVKAHFDKLVEEFKTYDGPPSGAPKKPTMLFMVKIRQEMDVELKERFLSDIASKAESDVRKQFSMAREIHERENTIMGVIENSITELIRAVATEAVAEGKAAKAAAERASGLIIPHPVWMQFDTYCSLVELKKQHRADIRSQLLLVKGAIAKLDAQKREHPEPAEVPIILNVEELTEDERNRRLEIERQETLCAEMSVQEAQCRRYYKWELLENLRERRGMREEDQAMKALVKEEAAISAAQDKSYAVTSTMMEEQQKQYKLTSFDKRRAELKSLTLERSKQAEEQAYMTLEDSRSKLLREIDKADRQRVQYEKEFGIVEETEPVDENDNKEEGNTGSGVGRFETVRVPSWMEVPEGWENWLLSQQKDYVKRAKAMRVINKRINRNLMIEAKRLDKFQQKSFVQWEDKYLSVYQENLETELREMDMSQMLNVCTVCTIFVINFIDIVW